MANELVHASQGTVLTQAEFEALGLHVCNSQATGDLIYASSATQLSRLAIGAVDTVFTCNGSIPSWSATPILNNAVAKGTWTASGTWTLPAFTLGGDVTINARVFDCGPGFIEASSTAGDRGFRFTSTQDTDVGAKLSLVHVSTTPAVNDQIAWIEAYGKDSAGNSTQYGSIQWKIANVTDATEAGKFEVHLINAGADSTVLTLSSVGVLNIVGNYQVDGVQVVTNRVVDARCDDAIASGDATTDGVIDSLRDAMITHGLIAAA